MTRFKDLQQAACMTNYHVAQYFGVADRTVCRWRSGENKPSIAVIREMNQLATAQVNKEVFGDD